MRRRREEEAAEAAREEDIETALARQPGEGRGAAAEGGLAWRTTATGERAEAAWRGGRRRRASVRRRPWRATATGGRAEAAGHGDRGWTAGVGTNFQPRLELGLNLNLYFTWPGLQM